MALVETEWTLQVGGDFARQRHRHQDFQIGQARSSLWLCLLCARELTEVKEGAGAFGQSKGMSSTSSGLSAALALAERSVPRYTSYPTAPHFSAAIGADEAEAWVAALPADATLSLYLHIPYCTAICNYCGCHTKAVQREQPIDAYTRTLRQEIVNLAAKSGAKKVTHIHWGGGTPSLLGPERLKVLFKEIASHFDLSGLAEHAIELDPRTVNAELAAGLKAIGITRASLGVQDLNYHVQKAIGRVQPFDVVERSVQHLQDVGIAAINLDLMYGLPNQSVEDVCRTAELAASLKPSRLAIFGYAHVPWFKVHQSV